MSKLIPDQKDQYICDVPEGTDYGNSHVPIPMCEDEPKVDPVNPAPPLCPPAKHRPLSEVCLSLKDCGCTFNDCVESVPPPTGCAPVHTGFGQYTGNLPSWVTDALCPKDCVPAQPDVMIDPWELVLNLTSLKNSNVNLAVLRDKRVQPMEANEFVALAHKMAKLAVEGKVAAPAEGMLDKRMVSIGIVQTGTEPNGTMSYGISLMEEGKAVGAPLPLTAKRDSNGNLETFELPVEIAQQHEANMAQS